jgi:hypothetical protein
MGEQDLCRCRWRCLQYVDYSADSASNADSADNDYLTIMLRRMMDSVTIVVKNEFDANHVLSTRIIHIK